MNNSARKVLKSKKQFILENYILNDGTLDSLEDNGILNEDLIQRINAEKTDNQKISTLLYILGRRGPTAFEHFVEAIRPDFHFVSETLETEYAKELENANKNEANSPDVSKNYDLPRHSSEESMSTEQTESENLEDSHTSSTGTQTYEVERNGNSDFMQRMMQESFRCWYTKIKSHMSNRNLRELSFRSPAPITYDMVDQLIDQLIETIEKCCKALRVKDNLVTHVIELKESTKKMKKELDEKEHVRNKYAHNTIKLENRCRDISEKLEEEKRNNQRLHADMASLKEKLESEIKEKDKHIEMLEQHLENAVLKTNGENVTERKDLDGHQTWYESRQDRSRDYQHKKRISYFKSNPRLEPNRRYKSSDISKHVRKMQHSNGRESKELTAVEEPDGARLARTQSFVESYKIQRTIPLEKPDADRLQSSDKENNDDPYDQSGEIYHDETDENYKQEQQILMVSNSSNPQTIPSEQTEFNRKSRGRKNSQRTKPRRKNSERQRVWIGTNENNQEAAQRAARNAPTEIKNLSSLVIVNNTKCQQHESPRGAKVMKHH